MSNTLSRQFGRWLDARGVGPLQLRAITLIFGLLISFVVLMLAADRYFSNRSIEREVTKQTQAIARMIGALVADRMSTGRLATVTPTATTLVQYGDTESIEIVDIRYGETLHIERSHFVLNNHLKEEDLTFIQDQGRDRMGLRTRHNSGWIEVTIPLYVEEELRGLVRTTSTNDFPTEKRRETVQRALAIAITFLALSLPILFLMLSRLLRPIRELTQAAKDMTRGRDVHFSLGLRRDDEIGGLARSFKRMTGHLARSMSEERRLAYIDPVTGLANRERMRRAIEMVAGLPPHRIYQRGLLFIDLDGFKRVNDMLGHDRGDKLLGAVSRRFEAVCRNSGYDILHSLETTHDRENHRKVARIGRLGGDEFVILARFNGHDHAERLANDIIQALAEPFLVDGHQIEVGASIGIARIPEDGSDASTLMRHADLAMYEAKEQGGRRVCRFSEAMGQRMLDRLILEMELRRAIGNDEIEAFYMPKIHLGDGRLCGFEALARWRHPTKGLIGPDRFIPVAERTGIIADIDRIVLRKAVKQAALWAKQGRPIPVAINVSPIHIERADFVSHIEHAVKEAGLPGYLLELEVTETAAMQEGTRVLAEMARLKALGIRIAIDDFGTGYSNLGLLHKIPANVIKIDGGLIRTLGLNDDSDLLIKTVVTLAKQLKLDIVAEGVDTIEKHNRLAELGCQIGQGYLYAPPMPLSKTESWLVEQAQISPSTDTDISLRLRA